VASVATVVVVGVKLPRPPRVERGRRRSVGVIRRRRLCHGRASLPGVIMLGSCTSTLIVTTLVYAATAVLVSAHGLVQRAPTKMKLDNPLAKHVPVVNTVQRRVRQVVRILQLLVLLEPTTPVEQQPFVIHVPVVLTVLSVRPVVRILQLLVLLEPMLVGQQPFVIHVTVVNTVLWVRQVVRILQLLVLSEPTPVVQQRVKHVPVGNTTNKLVKRLNQLLVKFAMWDNTKTKRGKQKGVKHVPVVLTVTVHLAIDVYQDITVPIVRNVQLGVTPVGKIIFYMNVAYVKVIRTKKDKERVKNVHRGGYRLPTAQHVLRVHWANILTLKISMRAKVVRMVNNIPA